MLIKFLIATGLVPRRSAAIPFAVCVGGFDTPLLCGGEFHSFVIHIHLGILSKMEK